MGIASYLIRRFLDKDATRNWVESNTREHIVNLDVGSLGPAHLGDPFDELHWLGPADDDRFVFRGEIGKSTTYNYSSMGVAVVAFGRKFNSMTLKFVSTSPFQGVVLSKMIHKQRLTRLVLRPFVKTFSLGGQSCNVRFKQ